MSSTKVSDVICSPFNDYEFIVVSNNIGLYKIITSEESLSKSDLEFGDNLKCDVVGVINKYQKQKTVAWYPGHHHREHLIALHEINTPKIKLLTLNSFNNTTDASLIAFELNLEKNRVCRSLQWNTSKYLASGFESLQSTKSIYIWDVFQYTKIFELEESETCCSLQWLPSDQDILFAGSSYQYISIFDLRKGHKPVESINTEFIYGFTIDSKDSRYASSYFENKLAIWDLRKFESHKEPVSVIELSAKIKKVQFNPIKAQEIAILEDGSNTIDVYHMGQKYDEAFDFEKINYNRRKYNQIPYVSFCWQSKSNDSIITINDKNWIQQTFVASYVSAEFSIDDKLWISADGNKINIFDIKCPDEEVDMGEKIRQRALKNYGIGEFVKNIELISDNDKPDAQVKYMWQWLAISSKLGEKAPLFDKFNGIKSIISNIAINENLFETFLDTNKVSLLELCGWNNWKELIQKLEEQNEYERAACISIFNDHMDKAIQILSNASKRGRNEYLALILALNLYKNEINSNNEFNGKKEFSQISSKLTNTYLRLLFACILDTDSLVNIINTDKSIVLSDKVAFALIKFKQEQLISFIHRLTSDCIKQGNLYGILLTGLNYDCIDLFQNYIHQTNDVQTAAVVIINAPFQDPRPNMWIDSYRSLLDKWMFWEQRAVYDLFRNNNVTETKLFIRCVFCAENISTKKRKTNQSQGMVCMNCQRPSVRCTICSLYMNFDPPRSAISAETDKMSYAFIFCQNCSHGGHLMHYVKWFKENDECPAMTCKCECSKEIRNINLC